MRKEKAALLFPNAVCGISIIAISVLKVSLELAIPLFGVAMIFLIGEYVSERLKQTRKEFGPYSPSRWIQEVERVRTVVLFILNLGVLFIFWFKPVLATAESNFGEAVFFLLTYGGYPLVVLKWDFGKLGTELARSQFSKEKPV